MIDAVFLTYLRLSRPLLLATMCLLAGCTGTAPAGDTGDLPTYTFAAAGRTSVVTFPGVLVASDSTDISLKPGLYGMLRWVAEEGTVVASGARIAVVDMTELERELQQTEAAVRRAQAQVESYDVNTRMELARARRDGRDKTDALVKQQQELAWLLAGKPLDQRWQALSAAEKAEFDRSHAQDLLAMTRTVVNRGFDSPMTLRRQQIDTQSRHIDADYARRRVARLGAGPEEDELAKGREQLSVASGEAWLAGHQAESASVSRHVESLSRRFQVTEQTSRKRMLERRFEQREVVAPRSGLVVLPTMYNGNKAGPGFDLWEGMTFMAVVGTGSFLLDAVVDEPIHALVTIGASATVTFDALPGSTFPGRVSFVGKAPKRRFRSSGDIKKFPVQVAVTLAAQPIRLGVKATVRVVTARGEGVVIPRDLVRTEGGSATVRLRDGGAIRELSADVETVDADWVRWRNAPASTGVLVY